MGERRRPRLQRLATITGGDIVVYGPTTDGNGALDVNGTFDVSGGTLVATGSAGMMVAPSTDSAQGWIATALGTTAAAGSEVVITDADGAEVASYTHRKDFASVVCSAPDIELGRDLHRHRRRHRDDRHRGRGARPVAAAARWAADARPPHPLPSHHVPRRNPDERQPAPARPRHPAGRARAGVRPPPRRRTWRDRLPRRLPSGRRAVAAGAVVAGLAIGGAGFGAGYAVGDDGSADTATTQTGTDWDRGQPGDGRGPMGDLDGQVPGARWAALPATTQASGTTDQAPDFDGDGQPDTDSGATPVDVRLHHRLGA